MGNAWTLFKSDLSRLFSNVVTTIIVLGLVFLPSIFCWYNILACWDVFNNTGNLKVAVANVDEGFESDLVTIRINIGESVVSALRANDQLDWVITDEQDAVDGAMSGKYYAAVVIPPTFSANMMTFYTDDAEQAEIIYYTNEKRSAIAPKVTDQGADRVAYQVDEAFTATLVEVAASVLSSTSEVLDSADAQGKVGALANHVRTAGNQMEQAAASLRAYAQVVSASQALVKSSSSLLAEAKTSADEISAEAAQATQSFSTVANAFDEASTALMKAFTQTSGYYATLPDAVDEAFDSADKLANDSATALEAQLPFIDRNISAFEEVSRQLGVLEGALPADHRSAAVAAKGDVDRAITMQRKLRSSIASAAVDIREGNAEAQASHEEAKSLANQAKEEIDGLSATYETDLKPQMENLSDELSTLVGILQGNADKLDDAASRASSSTKAMTSDLDAAISKLDRAADTIDERASELSQLATNLQSALARNDNAAVRELLSGDFEALAAALAAPVALDRNPVFPADNFGSQMAPLYTMLALWIGSLLLSVAIRVTVPQEDLDKLRKPRHAQVFLGHFGVFALISTMQSVCMGLGNVVFLGVQANQPLLYLLCLWVAGLVFAFIIYSLVATFANLGKAVAVLMLIVQVTGCNGAFPLQLLPSFIQSLSIWLPGTHAINAMRAAMFGIYNNDFWLSMALLALFLVPAGILGLGFSKPLSKFMRWYVERVESSKLMA